MEMLTWWTAIFIFEGKKCSQLGFTAGVAEGNSQENLLAWPSLVRPSLQFGCTLQEAMGSRPKSAELQVQFSLMRHSPPHCGSSPKLGMPLACTASEAVFLCRPNIRFWCKIWKFRSGKCLPQQGSFELGLQELLRLYEGEKHILIWREGKGQVLLHQEAQPQDALRPVWQVSMTCFTSLLFSLAATCSQAHHRLLCHRYLLGVWVACIMFGRFCIVVTCCYIN